MLRMEGMALKRFNAQAHLYVSPGTLPPADQDRYLVNWWGLMRHHFAPTRLLDWTESPYVAAYFAVSEFLEQPGAIWLVHARFLNEAAKGKGGILTDKTKQAPYFRDLGHPEIVEPLFPLQKSDRMAAQKGLFTVSRNVAVDHVEGIMNSIESPESANGELLFAKLILPSEIKREVRHQLEFMNVTAFNLFPGVDGLGRSVTESLELFEAPRDT